VNAADATESITSLIENGSIDDKATNMRVD